MDSGVTDSAFRGSPKIKQSTYDFSALPDVVLPRMAPEKAATQRFFFSPQRAQQRPKTPLETTSFKYYSSINKTRPPRDVSIVASDCRLLCTRLLTRVTARCRHMTETKQDD
ncbi:hypothetical protein BaRGS_00033357 [Batillaria attramentaria]|uniref:Uncharacterized protein n=1 Tax=Batillaria attramentaria TaxID=370345 RepID=A0ABD0JKG3_9CAEN